MTGWARSLPSSSWPPGALCVGRTVVARRGGVNDCACLGAVRRIFCSCLRPQAPLHPMAPLWSDGDNTPLGVRGQCVAHGAAGSLVRNTSVPAYLQPMVHEIKFSRADLLSDLRHDAKRQAYQWLCEECYYVFPAGIAQPDEIPEHFGIWVLHGGLDNGHFELLRPARHARCTLPLRCGWRCKATSLRSETERAQAQLGELP